MDLTRAKAWRRCLWLICLTAGCSRTLDLRVELEAPDSPNPFAQIETLESYGRVDGRLLSLGQGRWDQGPLALPTRLPITADRLVVVGRDSAGEVVASGASAPLDLLASDSEQVNLRFTQVGVVSPTKLQVSPRAGGLAVPWGTDALLLLGGADDDGCAREDTEILRPTAVEAGPDLPGGRKGAARAVVMEDGRIVVAGGNTGCGNGELAEAMWVADPANGEARLINQVRVPEGAAVAAVGSSSVLWLGGQDDIGRPQTEVVSVDIDRGLSRTIGQLDGPRTEAAAVTDADRVILFGGRSGTSTTSVLSDATVFVPARGRSLSERVPLGEPRAQAAAVRLRSGTFVVAGGVDARAGPVGLRSVTVGSERDVPLGKSVGFTALSKVATQPEIFDLADGSFVVTSQEELHWVSTVPLEVKKLMPAAEFKGRLVGGLRPDGLLALVGPDGQVGTFNPSVAALDPVGLSGGELGFGGPKPGLIPRNPIRWLVTPEGLSGSTDLALRPDQAPQEWVLLGTESAQDFVVQTNLQLSPQGRAALFWGFQRPGHFDFVSLSGSAAVGRVRDGRAVAVPCPSLSLQGFSAQERQQVRLTRRGSRVELDVGADGVADLVCDTTDSEAGPIGLGVVTQEVLFREVTFRFL